MHPRHLLKLACSCAVVALAVVAGLRAGTTQTGASLSGSYLQDFGPDGYKTWDLLSRESHVNSTDDSRLEISDLQLHLYSGGNKPRLEMTISSAYATVKNSSKETEVNGPGLLNLTGANDSYSVSGSDWSWNSLAHVINLGRNVVVKFNSTATAASTAAARSPHPIIILSDTLKITQQPGEKGQPGKNRFEFRGHISIADEQSKSNTNGEFHTTCDELVVVAARAESANTSTVAATPDASGKIPASLAVDKDSVESIIAQDNVVMRQGAIEAKGGQAQLYPAEEKVVMSVLPQVRVVLSGNATTADNYALLEGGRITWLRDKQVLDVEQGAVDAAGNPGVVTLSLPSSSPPRPGTTEARMLVAGQSLHAQFGAARRLDMDKSVHVEDPRFTVDAQHLDAEFDAPAKDEKAAPTATSSPPTNRLLTDKNTTAQLGKLNHLALSNGVTILQANLKATTPKAEILPDEASILLSDGPHVTDTLSNATIDATTIKLTTDGRNVDVRGAAGQPAQLVLPSLPLGDTSTNIETTILSNSAKMVRGLEYSNFTFSDNVQVNASSMKMTSGQLEIITNNVRPQPGEDPLADPTKRVQIIKLLASDQVVLTQRGFKARAATAEVNPLVGNPKITATEPATSGASEYRLFQLKGDKTGLTGPERAEVEVEMQNLNLGAVAGGTNTTPKPTTTPVLTTTTAIITSDDQWLFTSPTANYYVFTGNVKIDGGSFVATCDHMLVNCAQGKTPDKVASNSAIPRLAVDNIVAEGNVRIISGVEHERILTGERAVITPRESLFVLSGNVVLLNNKTGARLQNGTITVHGNNPPEVDTPQGPPGQLPARVTFTMPLAAQHLDELKKAAEKGSNNPGR